MAGHKVFADPKDALYLREFGGPGGVAFNDDVAAGDALRALWLAHGSCVDSLQVEYRNGHRTSRHGGTGGRGTWTAFQPGEHILQVEGTHGEVVEHLAIRTTHRLIAAGGVARHGTPFTMTAPEGHHILGFHGRCGRFLDAVGVCLAPLPAPPHLATELARAALRRMPHVTFAPLSADEMQGLE